MSARPEMNMPRPWDASERAWARECFAAGDTVEEIAQMAGREPDDVRTITGPNKLLTPMQRETASLYAAGLTFAEIDDLRGVKCRKPGTAASMVISRLRKQKRLAIPYRLVECSR